jgi:hypothetical protein
MSDLIVDKLIHNINGEILKWSKRSSFQTNFFQGQVQDREESETAPKESEEVG